MPTFAEIAGLLGQYFRDAAPGGELNREVQPQVVGDVARGGLLGLTADTLGTPVDLATMAMRPLGYSHPKPVGGSDWLAERMTTPSGSGAETAARTVTGLLTPSPADVAHLVPGLLGATVWHGSPHKFDKFDISKIGTGEGAQAYGHGLYVAENPGVAKSYQTALASQNTERTLADLGVAEEHLSNASSALRQFTTAAEKGGLPWDRAAKNAQNSSIGLRAVSTDVLAKKMQQFAESRKGAFYKVDLPDEHIAKMLDWDKPLSQQPESVRKALDGIPFNKRGVHIDDENSVQDLLNGLTRGKFNNPQNSARAVDASKVLKNNGIPGIKYLDGGSRTAGEGTRNYVVFDDSLLKILERQ